jgi:hypothetical protein
MLFGVTFDDLRLAAVTADMAFEELPEAQAVAGLGPDHLVVTDSQRWALVTLEATADRAAVELLHDRLMPALPHGARRIGYHHSVEDTLPQASPEVGVAVLLPAPEVDLVLRIAADDRRLPEKATSFQPKPSLGVLIRSLRDG